MRADELMALRTGRRDERSHQNAGAADKHRDDGRDVADEEEFHLARRLALQIGQPSGRENEDRISVWRQLIMARLRLEPNRTTTWIGSNRFAIVVNTNTPPPSPSAPAIRLPRKDTMQSTNTPVNDRPVPAIQRSTKLFK